MQQQYNEKVTDIILTTKNYNSPDCSIFMHNNIMASWGLKFLWSSTTCAAAGLKQLGLLHEFSYDVQKGVFLKSLFGGWEGVRTRQGYIFKGSSSKCYNLIPQV